MRANADATAPNESERSAGAAPRAALPIAGSLLLFVLLSALFRLPMAGGMSGGEVPRTCASISVRGDLLDCTGGGHDPGARGWLLGSKLDLNKASLSDLRALPGVGRKTAAAIFAARQASRFSSVADLQRVKGVGPKTVARLSPWLQVTPSAANEEPPAAAVRRQ